MHIFIIPIDVDSFGNVDRLDYADNQFDPFKDVHTYKNADKNANANADKKPCSDSDEKSRRPESSDSQWDV
jgi:hypothetical protein